jgi:hypothetical protein
MHRHIVINHMAGEQALVVDGRLGRLDQKRHRGIVRLALEKVLGRDPDFFEHIVLAIKLGRLIWEGGARMV